MKATNVLFVDNVVLSNGCRFVADIDMGNRAVQLGFANGLGIDDLRRELIASLEALRVDYDNLDEMNRGASWCVVRRA